MNISIIFALLSAVFASLVAIFGSIGLSKIDSTMATAVRSIVMAGFLVIVAYFMGKFSLLNTLTSKSMLFIVLSGVAGALSWLCYFFALRYGSPTIVAALDRLSVAFVFVFSLLFLREQFVWNKGLGIVLIVIGAILTTLKF